MRLQLTTVKMKLFRNPFYVAGHPSVQTNSRPVFCS